MANRWVNGAMFGLFLAVSSREFGTEAVAQSQRYQMEPLFYSSWLHAMAVFMAKNGHFQPSFNLAIWAGTTEPNPLSQIGASKRSHWQFKMKLRSVGALAHLARAGHLFGLMPHL